jgi:hypothetical protein
VKFLLLLALVAAIGAIYLPGQREGTTGVCVALDARIGRLLHDENVKAALPSQAGALSPGAALAETVRRRVPFIPPEVACAAAYWMSVYEPDLHRLAALAGG